MIASPGKRPARRSAGRAVAPVVFQAAGKVACACANAACCATTSALATWPSAYWRFNSSSEWLSISMICLVAVDLSAQSRLLYRRGDHVGGQSQVSGFELKALRTGLGFERLNLPPRMPPNASGVYATVTCAVWRL